MSPDPGVEPLLHWAVLFQLLVPLPFCQVMVAADARFAAMIAHAAINSRADRLEKREGWRKAGMRWLQMD
ncbi:hypothetical protein MASR2M8_02980 [Opitutaceae bacterium]